MRLAAGLVHAAHALVGLFVATAIIVASHRLGWVSTRSVVASAIAAALVAAVYVLLRTREVPQAVAAAEADERLHLSDRLGSAVAFLDVLEPSELMQAAVRDAARASQEVDPKRVVILRAPRAARVLPVAVLTLVGASFLHQPARTATVPRAPQPRSHLVVEEDALEAERQAVRKLARDAQAEQDPALAELAQKLDALLQAVDQKQLSRSEAFAQLALLEQNLGPKPGDLPKPSERLKAMQSALASSAQTKQLAQAIAKDDLATAQKELEKLAAEAEARAKEAKSSSKNDAAQEELARALDRASKALDEAQKRSDTERDNKMKQLEEEQRQLKKQQQEHPEDQENERRLQRNQRELERLEREKQQQSEQRRQLQRLSRDLEKAAQELRNKMSPEAMKKMAEELGKMEDEIKKLGGSGRASMQIAELKEVLRRAGRAESGEGGKGKTDEREQRLSEFDERAGGQPNALLLGGDNPGENTLLLPMPGAGQNPGSGDQPGDQQGGGKGDEPQRPGDGIGDQHDPNVQGDATKLKTQQKIIHARGQTGNGPSKSQTILSASERGFANRSYRDAYKDYASAVEEVMSQESVPPGYRYYVKRYFQLIRPRE